MPTKPTIADPTPEEAFGNGMIFLLAAGAGLSVAAIYYNQPILEMLASEFRVSAARIGSIPTLTQLGYAVGILLLVPAGDRYDRKRVILWKTVLLCLALIALGSARSLLQLQAASVVVGLSSTLAQDFVPAAAVLSPAARRGRSVGSVMTGLLLGILLSRVVSGGLAAHWGWRSVFYGAAASVALLGVVAARKLPSFARTSDLGYGALLLSLFALWRRHAALRRAAIAQSLLSAAFSAFWSTLALMLARPPFALGSAVAGAFGLAGAAGALAAPLAGGVADRHGPGAVTKAGAALVLLSFGAFCVFPGSLVVLVAGTVTMDLGIQASMIAHQSIIYGLEPEARSRLNAVLVGSMFVGMSLGATAGSIALERGGWRTVAFLAACSGAAALAVRLGAGRGGRN